MNSRELRRNRLGSQPVVGSVHGSQFSKIGDPPHILCCSSQPPVTFGKIASHQAWGSDRSECAYGFKMNSTPPKRNHAEADRSPLEDRQLPGRLWELLFAAAARRAATLRR